MAAPSFFRITSCAKCAWLFLLLPALGGFAPKDEAVWRDARGQAVPDTESRKSKQGFGGHLVVTPDADWEEKWQTSPETTPQFTTSETVRKGEKLTILIFFLNPAMDEKGDADVTCDIQSIRPDGSFSIDLKDAVCFRGKLEGDPHNIRLASPVISYLGEAKDLPGKWTIKVTLIDNQRQVRLR